MDLLFILLATLSAAGESPGQKLPEFSRGQVWSYVTRSSEPESTLTVVEVSRPKGEPPIVLIALVGLRVRFRATPTGPFVRQTQLPCVAMSEEALRKSVRVLLRVETTLPPYLGDCSDWYLFGEPTYSTSVADAVGQIEKALN